MAVITFKNIEKKKTSLQPFKESKLSICWQCTKFELHCSNALTRLCGTDKKVGKAFIERCNGFERKTK